MIYTILILFHLIISLDVDFIEYEKFIYRYVT